MSTYLFLPHKTGMTHSYVHTDDKPERIGTTLMRYFYKDAQAQTLFQNKKKIHHLEKNTIWYMTNKEIFRARFGIFYTNESTRSIKETLELLVYGLGINYIYIFDHHIWTCYSGYMLNNKKVIEEIHLDSEYFRGVVL